MIEKFLHQVTHFEETFCVPGTDVLCILDAKKKKI